MFHSISIIEGNITHLAVDVIVNAANTSLLGGSGVDGAIHRAAGKELLHACRLLGGCQTGDAKLTKGYNLKASFIIHTVGPVWQSGYQGEANLLASCYSRSLGIAHTNSLKSIAFPCISTGIYRFPKQKAAEIAIHTVQDFLNQQTSIEHVIFCCFENEDFLIYQNLLDTLMPSS